MNLQAREGWSAHHYEGFVVNKGHTEVLRDAVVGLAPYRDLFRVGEVNELDLIKERAEFGEGIELSEHFLLTLFDPTRTDEAFSKARAEVYREVINPQVSNTTSEIKAQLGGIVKGIREKSPEEILGKVELLADSSEQLSAQALIMVGLIHQLKPAGLPEREQRLVEVMIPTWVKRQWDLLNEVPDLKMLEGMLRGLGEREDVKYYACLLIDLYGVKRQGDDLGQTFEYRGDVIRRSLPEEATSQMDVIRVALEGVTQRAASQFVE